MRLCLLAARQWQGMFRWMGEPTAFADSSFNKTVLRYKSPAQNVRFYSTIAAILRGFVR